MKTNRIFLLISFLIIHFCNNLFAKTSLDDLKGALFSIRFGNTVQTAFKLKGKKILVTSLRGFTNEFGRPKISYSEYKITNITRMQEGYTWSSGGDPSSKVCVTGVIREYDLAFIAIDELWKHGAKCPIGEEGFTLNPGDTSFTNLTEYLSNWTRVGANPHLMKLDNAIGRYVDAKGRNEYRESITENLTNGVLVIYGKLNSKDVGMPILNESNEVCGVVQQRLSGSMYYASYPMKWDYTRLLPNSKTGEKQDRQTYIYHTHPESYSPPAVYNPIAARFRSSDFISIEDGSGYDPDEVIALLPFEFKRYMSSRTNKMWTLYQIKTLTPALKKRYPFSANFLALFKCLAMQNEDNRDSLYNVYFELKKISDSLKPTAKELKYWKRADRQFDDAIEFLLSISSFILAPSPVYYQDTVQYNLKKTDALFAQKKYTEALSSYMLHLATHPGNSDSAHHEINTIKNNFPDSVYKEILYQTIDTFVLSNAAFYAKNFEYLHRLYGLKYATNATDTSLIFDLSFGAGTSINDSSLSTLYQINGIRAGKYWSYNTDFGVLYLSLMLKSICEYYSPIINDTINVAYVGKADGTGWRGNIEVYPENFYYGIDIKKLNVPKDSLGALGSGLNSTLLSDLCKSKKDFEKDVAIAYLRAYYAQDLLRFKCSKMPLQTKKVVPVTTNQKGGEFRGVHIIVTIPIAPN